MGGGASLGKIGLSQVGGCGARVADGGRRGPVLRARFWLDRERCIRYLAERAPEPFPGLRRLPFPSPTSHTSPFSGYEAHAILASHGGSGCFGDGSGNPGFLNAAAENGLATFDAVVTE